MIITCAKSNLPILGGRGWEGHPFSRTVLLRAGRPPAAGWYDGAGISGGTDLRAIGALDEIRAGTACMVLGDRYYAGDTPRGSGRSRVDEDPGSRPGREFVAACTRIGGFATYEGYVLARDGKVTPEVGAALTGAHVAALRCAVDGLRRAMSDRMRELSSYAGNWVTTGV